MVITKIFKQIKLSKGGKPFASVVISTSLHGDAKISGFGCSITWKWKVGDTIDESIISQNGQYFNFTVEGGERLPVYQMPATVAFVLDVIKAGGVTTTPSEAPRVPENRMENNEDINLDDIPF